MPPAPGVSPAADSILAMLVAAYPCRLNRCIASSTMRSRVVLDMGLAKYTLRHSKCGKKGVRLVSDSGFLPETGDARSRRDAGARSKGGAEAPSLGAPIGGGRLRRSAPLVALTARTAGGAVVAGLRSKFTGADSTEFHIRAAERYAELLGHS